MKKMRFIFIGCLLAVAAISLFTLTGGLSGREGQDGNMQTSPYRATNAGNPGRYGNDASGTKNNSVSGNPDRGSIKTNDVSTGKSVSKPVTSKINRVPSKNLSMPGAGGDLQTGANGRSTAPANTTDEAKRKIAGRYAHHPETRGQHGETRPNPDAIIARKEQDILKYYKDRTATADVVEETELREDGSQVQVQPNTNSTNTQQLSVNDNTENTIDSLAQQNVNSENIDHELQVKQLLAALAESNPPEVRLQAIYLLEDAEPSQVKNFLDDKNDLIRNEAERFVGILPQDYN
jgi:hypothetical protein